MVMDSWYVTSKPCTLNWTWIHATAGNICCQQTVDTCAQTWAAPVQAVCLSQSVSNSSRTGIQRQLERSLGGIAALTC